MMSCVVEKFIRDDVVAPFSLLSVVIVTLPFSVAVCAPRDGPPARLGCDARSPAAISPLKWSPDSTYNGVATFFARIWKPGVRSGKSRRKVARIFLVISDY